MTVEQRAASPQELATLDLLRRHAHVVGVDVDGNRLEGWLAYELILNYVKGACPRTRTRTIRRVLDRLVDDELVEAAMVGRHLAFRWSPRWAL